MKHYVPRLPITIEAQETQKFLIRITDEGTMNAPIEISKIDILQMKDGLRQWISGLMSGVFGLVGIYAFVLVLRLRQPIFVWLCALATASLFQWLFFHWGEAGLWLPVEYRTWLSNRLIVVCLSCTAFCSYFFYIEACNLRKYFPKVCKFIQFFAFVQLSNSVLVFVLPYTLSVRLLFLGVFGLVLIATTVGYRAVQGETIAQRLALAAGLLMLGYLLTISPRSPWGMASPPCCLTSCAMA